MKNCMNSILAIWDEKCSFKSEGSLPGRISTYSEGNINLILRYSTGWGISLGTVGVAVSRLKPHLSNFGSLLKLQRLIFPESLGMIK